MSNFINKILGRDDEHEHHSATVIKTQTGDNKNHMEKSAGGHQTESRSVERDGVNIKSTVSSDAVSTVSMANQQKLNDLVSKLGTTHNQIDDYAKQQSAKINEDIQREINEVVARTRREQENLLKQASEHTKQIDNEYRTRLQKMVEDIDADKAKRIAEIEKDLNQQQTGILQAARAEIDTLNQKAANLKIGAIQQAQERATAEAVQITAQAANLQTSTLHHQQGTTTIKTEVTGGTTAKDVSVGPATVTARGASTTTTSESHVVGTAGSQSSSETKRN